MSVVTTKPGRAQSSQMTVVPRCLSEPSDQPGAHLTILFPCQQHQQSNSPACPFAVAPAAFRRAPQERLTAAEESALFGELRQLRRRLCQLGEVDATTPRSQRIEAMQLSCRACSIRRYLAQCYFKLAVAVARSFATRYQDIDDLVGQACVTLMRALDLFDVERGFRFSTYVTRAMRTELSRYLLRRRPVGRAVDPTHFVQQVQPARWRPHPGPAVFCALESLLDDLTPREADVVRSRFGLRDRPGCETLQAVADRLGISRERVRQLERGALLKLRKLAEQDERAELLNAVD